MRIGQILMSGSEQEQQLAIDSQRRRDFYSLWFESLRELRRKASTSAHLVTTHTGGVALRKYWPRYVS